MKWFVLVLSLCHFFDVAGRLLAIAMDSYVMPTAGSHAFNAVANALIGVTLLVLWSDMPS